MPKIPFTEKNAMNCICGRCPVQINSGCSKKKIEIVKKMMAPGAPKGPMPKPADVPWLYCAGGKAACKDLEFSKMCICSSCPLWNEYRLPYGKSMGYYCRDGMAK